MHLEKVGLIRRAVKMVAETLMGKKRVCYSVLAVIKHKSCKIGRICNSPQTPLLTLTECTVMNKTISG